MTFKDWVDAVRAFSTTRVDVLNHLPEMIPLWEACLAPADAAAIFADGEVGGGATSPTLH